MSQGCSSTLPSHWAECAVPEFSQMPCSHLADLTDSLPCIYGWYIVVKMSEFLLARGCKNVTTIKRSLIWPPTSCPIILCACHPAHQEMEPTSPPCESGLALWPALTNRRWWKWCLFWNSGDWVLRELATSAYSPRSQPLHKKSSYPKTTMLWGSPDTERDHRGRWGMRHVREAFLDLLAQPNPASSWEQPNEESYLIPHGAEDPPPPKYCPNHTITWNKTSLLY